MTALGADEIIARLGLAAHPEGGWFRETFRDAPEGGRGHSTAIYFLLKRGERSHWHRVRDAAEVWHFHAGGPLRLSLWNGRDGVEHHILGPAIEDGARPQCVVPAGWWQAAEPLGDFTLAGCTVAPGFDFAAFELAAPGWSPPSS
jgi:predicted cupin superfamily sugar epimerase